jgi:hypothetical protein
MQACLEGLEQDTNATLLTQRRCPLRELSNHADNEVPTLGTSQSSDVVHADSAGLF